MNDDPLFGKLEKEQDWVGVTSIKLFNKNYDVPLIVTCYSDSISPNQRKTYENFVNCKEYICKEIEKNIFNYYNEYLSKYMDHIGCLNYFDLIAHSYKDLSKNIKPITIGVPYCGNGDNVIVFLFDLRWDIEHGIGIKIVNNKIDFVGKQSSVL